MPVSGDRRDRYDPPTGLASNSLSRATNIRRKRSSSLSTNVLFAILAGCGCGSSKLDPSEFIGGFDRLAIACGAWRSRQEHHSRRPQAANREPAPRLLLESIALRHQIAVLERSRTRRPCFRLWDRLFWILLSRSWWPPWRDSLIIVQTETFLRWRCDGWSALWRYRARSRWRGGRPRVSREVRQLIVRMAHENFLWGAPRIHGELQMLGFSVSQATVSGYMPARSRRPRQSWLTFLRNQAMAFGHREYYEERSRGDGGLRSQSYSAQLKRSGVAQIAMVWVGFRRGFGRSQPAPNNRRIRLRSAQCDHGVAHRAASVSGGSRRALCNRRAAPFLIRSPPRQRAPASLPRFRPRGLG